MLHCVDIDKNHAYPGLTIFKNYAPRVNEWKIKKERIHGVNQCQIRYN